MIKFTNAIGDSLLNNTSITNTVAVEEFWKKKTEVGYRKKEKKVPGSGQGCDTSLGTRPLKYAAGSYIREFK